MNKEITKRVVESIKLYDKLSSTSKSKKSINPIKRVPIAGRIIKLKRLIGYI